MKRDEKATMIRQSRIGDEGRAWNYIFSRSEDQSHSIPIGYSNLGYSEFLKKESNLPPLAEEGMVDEVAAIAVPLTCNQVFP
jgi:hypothetical protein